jgi:hypothetical protein
LGFWVPEKTFLQTFMGNNIYTDDEMNLFLVLRLKSCLKQLPQVEHVEGGGGVGWGK